MTPNTHQPVMLKEAMEWLNPHKGGVYVDGTFGRGGYSRAILQTENTVVYAFDRDRAAIQSGVDLQNNHHGRLHLIHACFGSMENELHARDVKNVDGVVFDVGVSSPQIDDAMRGFSFRNDGPLDMRMGNTGDSAADIIAHSSEDELSTLIFNFGEERFSRRIARAIVAARLETPLERTEQLANVIRKVVPRARDGIDPATRTFQALRIAVNDELGELQRGLAGAKNLLRDGGRLVVVSFHSLEDRIVKNFMRDHSGKAPALSRHLPEQILLGKAANSNRANFQILTNKPVCAGAEEAKTNPRAASAKLRAAARIISESNTESLDGNPQTTRK